MPGASTIRVEPLRGEAMASALPALAELRIAVFRAYPYLYDGTLAYEQAYLEAFAASEGAVLVAAFDGERIVGASTASPMRSQAEALAAPFAARGHDVDSLYYFGESVLLDRYRGLGIGHAFFDHREARAREAGATHATFASVLRPAYHPLRPADYRPLDGFWRSRGYRPAEGITTSFAWKDVDGDCETEKPMQFWIRALTG